MVRRSEHADEEHWCRLCHQWDKACGCNSIRQRCLRRLACCLPRVRLSCNFDWIEHVVAAEKPLTGKRCLSTIFRF